MNLDEIDRALLRILQTDARISNADLARQVNLSPPAVHARMRRLQEQGVIRGYVAVLDHEALGYEMLCLISIRMERHQRPDIERVRAAVGQMPEVLECYHVSGEFDFLLKIVVEDMKAYEALVRDKLSHIKGLGKIQSCFALATNKQVHRLPLERLD